VSFLRPEPSAFTIHRVYTGSPPELSRFEENAICEQSGDHDGSS
jgi:hypothetical protein